MAYQSPSDAGKFHVFSSKPSKLGQSIISAASMMNHGILDINETEIQPRVEPKSMTPGMKSYFMEEYIFSASNTVLVNHMDYDLEESAANSSTTNTTQQNSHGTANGGTAQGSDSNNSEVAQGSSSRRASFDCLSDSSTVVASEHSPCSSMSAWIERELIRSDNNSLMTGRDQGAISGTSGRQPSGVDHMVHINSASNGNGSDMPEIMPAVGYQAGQDRLSLLNSVLAAQLETARKAKASESNSCSNQSQTSQSSSTYSSASGHQHSQLPSASSLGKRSRGNSDLDGETRTGDGTLPYDLPHDNTGEPGPSNNNAGNPHKRTMTTRCQASRNDAMGPPPVPPAHRVVPDLDQPVSPQPRESPHSTGIQPREGHSKHLFAGSFERDFRDAFARPNRTQASPDDIPMRLATGELHGMPGPSASSSSPVRVPTPIPSLRPPSSQAPVTPTPAHATTSGVAASAPATTTTDGPTAPVPLTITPPDTPPLPAVPAATVPQVPTLEEAQLNTQPVRRLSNDQAQSGPSGSRRRRHWHAAQQQQQSESSSSEVQLIQHVARPVETTSRNSQNSQTSQTIRAYQSMQSMHAIQNMQALNSLDAMQGLPGIPTMPPEVPVSPMTPVPPVTPVTHLLPPAASAHIQGQHSPPFENTTTFIELSVPPTMPEHTVEELTVTEYYGAPADMAITGMGMVDFASPEDIARILAFGPEDQDPPLSSVNSMNFQWPPN
ncbi:hypothetical protein SEUCBS140593_003384 [Sporothrix eucalyptigena]|uniref:Uncharacterized protein n=1 Tax=Sporothrix eucalyptigena TaxID=1812306 RepID=A0ABP0BEK3_9PEZI